MVDEIRLITEYTLTTYPIGVVAGGALVLRRDLAYTDSKGAPTGRIDPAGSTFEVIPGVESEPNVIWLLDPNGDRCTWDESLWDWFERLERLNA